jgi:hypothetical protein
LLLEPGYAEGAEDERGEHEDEDGDEIRGCDAYGDAEEGEGHGQREQDVGTGVRTVRRAADLPPFVASLQVAQGHPDPPLPVRGKF